MRRFPLRKGERGLAQLEIWALEIDGDLGKLGHRRELNAEGKRSAKRNKGQEIVGVSGASMDACESHTS